MPRIPRPFVHRAGPAAPGRPAAGSDSAVARHAPAPPADRADARGSRATEPRPTIEPAAANAAQAASAGEDEWPLALSSALGGDDPSIGETLAGSALPGSAPLVPGADARPRPATPPSAVAARADAPIDEAESAADTEWLAMSELGDFETPAAPAPAPVSRTARSERSHPDLGAGVVPPAQAWPEDVWADTGTVDADVDPVVPDAAHPVTLSNDVVPASDDDATLGSISAAPSATAYPPGVPDTLDAYALDGAPSSLGAPSAVYSPDTAGAWTDSAGGVSGECGMPISLEPRDDRMVEPDGASALADRLRDLADEVQGRGLTVGAFDPAMRDSEALVALLGALLRTGR
jgi:hypothetical protein